MITGPLLSWFTGFELLFFVSWMLLPHILSHQVKVQQKLASQYFLTCIHSFLLIICTFIVLYDALLSKNDLLSLFDCQISKDNKHGFIVNKQSLPNPVIHYFVIFSISYYVFDAVIEYFYIAKTYESVWNCSRLQLLLFYRWTMLLNLVIIHYRLQYVNMVIVLLGLHECIPFILCLGHIFTENAQNTYYIRKACLISIIGSIICKIIVPMLLVVCCLYYRFLYWAIIDFGNMSHKRHLHHDFIDLLLNNIMLFVHTISFFGIFVASIWWTINLYQKSQYIPITYHGIDGNIENCADKKNK